MCPVRGELAGILVLLYQAIEMNGSVLINSLDKKKAVMAECDFMAVLLDIHRPLYTVTATF